MAYIVCLEQDKALRTLKKAKKHDLVVIDTDGISTAAIKAACARGVWVYGYLNVGALEMERSYYKDYKNLILAPYDGWSGEYWVDVTKPAWREHILVEAKKIRETGAIGVYLDNTDIYYMVKSGKVKLKDVKDRSLAIYYVYHALEGIVDMIKHDIGLIVMPNGGDDFVRRFITEHPNVIQTINQEGLFYEDFKKQSKEETEYRKDWCKWAQKHISGKVRIIDYCKKPAEIAKVKAYCFAHGWDCYISKHKNLEGD